MPIVQHRCRCDNCATIKRDMHNAVADPGFPIVEGADLLRVHCSVKTCQDERIGSDLGGEYLLVVSHLDQPIH